MVIIKQHILWKYIKHLIVFSALYMFAISCTTDEHIQPIPDDNTDVEGLSVRLTINTPPINIPKNSTKSQTPEECEIDEIRVLVFKNDKYMYSSEGNITNFTNTSTTFNVALKSSSTPVTLLLIANSNQAIDNSNILANDSKASVKEKLQLAFTNSGIATLFPMYGEHDMPSLNSNGDNNISNIKMLRSVARADVVVSKDISNFELVSVQVFRANNRMQIIPENMDNLSVSSPSIPSGANGNITTTEIAVTGNDSESQVYLPESVAPTESNRVSEATCIVIGGKLNNSPSPTYYRIDFNPGIDGHPFGQILRNHKYVFNIKKISISGAKTPEEAANTQSTGIIAEVQTWDENSTDMYFDSEHYFGISARTVSLMSWSGSVKELIVNTDINDYTLYWSDADGNPLGEESQSSIQNSNFLVNVQEDGTRIHVESLDNNYDMGDIVNYFVIKAGLWNIIIKVVQSGYWANQEMIVRVLSFTNTGDLGNGYSEDDVLDASGIPMRQILNIHFYPATTIDIGGYSFKELPQSAISSNILSSGTMADFDVIFLPYDSKPNIGSITNLIRWLSVKENRVLIVAADGSSTNINLLSALGDTWGWIYQNNGGNFRFVPPTEENRMFTTTGPFGSVSSSSVFGRYDALWGRTSNYSEDVIPLLTSSYDGGMVLGVNKKRRIVYIGDCNLFTNTGTNYLSGGGSVDTDQDRLLANLWAWITEVVLSGK